MEHGYEFFDRYVFDPIWRLKWAEFQRKYPSKWALDPTYIEGQDGETLASVIAFAVTPDPSREEVERIIATRTIRWTVQHSALQLWLLSSIIVHGLPKLRKWYFWTETDDISGLIAVAVDAYLSRRISTRSLSAILKLHSISMSLIGWH
jgi:hypothetical protein